MDSLYCQLGTLLYRPALGVQELQERRTILVDANSGAVVAFAVHEDDSEVATEKRRGFPRLGVL